MILPGPRNCYQWTMGVWISPYTFLASTDVWSDYVFYDIPFQLISCPFPYLDESRDNWSNIIRGFGIHSEWNQLLINWNALQMQGLMIVLWLHTRESVVCDSMLRLILICLCLNNNIYVAVGNYAKVQHFSNPISISTSGAAIDALITRSLSRMEWGLSLVALLAISHGLSRMEWGLSLVALLAITHSLSRMEWELSLSPHFLSSIISYYP